MPLAFDLNRHAHLAQRAGYIDFLAPEHVHRRVMTDSFAFLSLQSQQMVPAPFLIAWMAIIIKEAVPGLSIVTAHFPLYYLKLFQHEGRRSAAVLGGPSQTIASIDSREGA